MHVHLVQGWATSGGLGQAHTHLWILELISSLDLKKKPLVKFSLLPRGLFLLKNL